MSKISINTEKYIKNKIKEVEINGNNFTVRKPGAGEQLDSLENIRVLNNLKKENGYNWLWIWTGGDYKLMNLWIIGSQSLIFTIFAVFVLSLSFNLYCQIVNEHNYYQVFVRLMKRLKTKVPSIRITKKSAASPQHCTLLVLSFSI